MKNVRFSPYMSKSFFTCIQDQFPIVNCFHFEHVGDESFFDDDSSFVSYIQGEIIDELYDD